MNLDDPFLDPAINPDSQEALSIKYTTKAIVLIPLRSGRLAVFDRQFNLRQILDEVPTVAELQAWSSAYQFELSAHSRRAEAAFYGEPSVRDLAHDIKKLHQPQQSKPTRPAKAQAIEIEIPLDDPPDAPPPPSKGEPYA